MISKIMSSMLTMFLCILIGVGIGKYGMDYLVKKGKSYESVSTIGMQETYLVDQFNVLSRPDTFYKMAYEYEMKTQIPIEWVFAFIHNENKFLFERTTLLHRTCNTQTAENLYDAALNSVFTALYIGRPNNFEQACSIMDVDYTQMLKIYPTANDIPLIR